MRDRLEDQWTMKICVIYQGKCYKNSMSIIRKNVTPYFE